jgi:transposase
VSPSVAELAEQLAQVMAVNTRLREVIQTQHTQLEAQTAQLHAKDALVAMLTSRVEELERRLGKDSSTSSKPPSSDSPYAKPKRTSLRGKSGRAPGKQHGAPRSTLAQVPDPNEVIDCDPPLCGDCGADLAGAPMVGMHKRQVFEVRPPPPPRVIEYRVIARRCLRCGVSTCGQAPVGVTGRVQYGPEVTAHAANLVCGHYLPVSRAARLMRAMLGVAVSVGTMAGIRGRAARLLEDTFLPHVRTLLSSAKVLGVDETPARAAGGLTYVHVACTEYLTALHTGRRTKDAIDDGGVLPGFDGVLVRDGYAGYVHLTDAVHAWCGAHSLRDLAAFHRADPDGQVWARAMADALVDANLAAHTARAAGLGVLDEQVLSAILARYRGAVAVGLSANLGERGGLAVDALTLVRRFRDHEDMILRFMTDLAVPFTNNQSERDVRPVKIQQRTSGGCWRTLAGLADFAVVQSYLSTATKWGIDTLDALRQLFTTGPWLPPAVSPDRAITAA